MIGYLQKLADLSILAFVVSAMLTLGMSQRLRDVVAPLKRPLPVLLAFLLLLHCWPLH